MILKKIYLIFVLLLAISQLSWSQGSVSMNVNQILVVEDPDPQNPPRSIYIKLNTEKIDVQYMKGTRVMITGKVSLGIPNLFFLEVLIKKGRYDLFMSPDGGNGLRIEDKTRQPMILQGEQCPEKVSYTIYIPETITTVVFENTETGDSEIIAVTLRDKKIDPAAATAVSNNQQVTIKEK